MMLSIVAQLCASVSGFETALTATCPADELQQLLAPGAGLQRLFDRLLKAPLEKLDSEGAARAPMFILIDALDECTGGAQSALLRIVAEHFPSLPAWMRLVVTSRDEPAIVHMLERFDPLSLNCDDNVTDAALYLEHMLAPRVREGELAAAVKLMREKSGSLFLYLGIVAARLDMLELGAGEVLSVVDLGAFPAGMDDVYACNFSRVFDEAAEKTPAVGKTAAEEMRALWADALPLLQVVCAAREPLPVAVAEAALGLTKAASFALRNAIGTLFPARDGVFHVIHKSVVDWLTDDGRAGRFAVDAAAGHARLLGAAVRPVGVAAGADADGGAARAGSGGG